RCHDHKYDPLKMKDFYSLSAYFNSLEGNPLDGNATRHPPVVRVPTPEQDRALAGLDQKIQGVRKTLAERAAGIVYDDGLDAKESEQPKRGDFVWIDDNLPAGAKPETDGRSSKWTFVKEPKFSG